VRAKLVRELGHLANLKRCRVVVTAVGRIDDFVGAGVKRETPPPVPPQQPVLRGFPAPPAGVVAEIVTGPAGSGKSFECSKRVAAAASAGRGVAMRWTFADSASTADCFALLGAAAKKQRAGPLHVWIDVCEFALGDDLAHARQVGATQQDRAKATALERISTRGLSALTRAMLSLLWHGVVVDEALGRVATVPSNASFCLELPCHISGERNPPMSAAECGARVQQLLPISAGIARTQVLLSCDTVSRLVLDDDMRFVAFVFSLDTEAKLRAACRFDAATQACDTLDIAFAAARAAPAPTTFGDDTARAVLIAKLPDSVTQAMPLLLNWLSIARNRIGFVTADENPNFGNWVSSSACEICGEHVCSKKHDKQRPPLAHAFATKVFPHIIREITWLAGHTTKGFAGAGGGAAAASVARIDAESAVRELGTLVERGTLMVPADNGSLVPCTFRSEAEDDRAALSAQLAKLMSLGANAAAADTVDIAKYPSALRDVAPVFLSGVRQMSQMESFLEDSE
jgi:hypothetical protein